MPQNAAGSSRVPNALVRAFALLVTAGALLFPRLSHAAPDPLNVLLVANGYYTQETQIEDHLLDLGYSVTRLKDYRLKGTTSLAPYDLIVISEFAPGIPTSGIDNLKTAGKPILIVEYWDFFYSYKLGLTTSSSCGYVGTDTITSIREGYDDFTSRVGAEALVYQPQYTVYGIDIANVKPNATPLYWSSASFEEVAVLVDYAKKIAVTGVYDTRKYTVDAWKMLDILLAQILPAPATYATMDEVAQAYVDSGLYTLAADIEADLKQDPQSWTFDEAELYAWQLVTGWGLGELWDYTILQLGDVFDEPIAYPDFEGPYFPPTRPYGTNPGFLTDTDEVEHWFMGQYWDSTTLLPIDHPYRWFEYYRGTDLGLGISVQMNGRRYYYMGDTWDLEVPDQPPVHYWSEKSCGDYYGDLLIPARCDDMIAVSQDDDPNDGIKASPVFLSEEVGTRWKPITIPGVHNDFSPQLHDQATGYIYWNRRIYEPAYTVPTGAVATQIPLTTMSDGITVPISLPGVMLWYGTAIAPYGDNGIEPLDSTDPSHRPTSWVGCSLDGVTFRACYRNAAGDAVPFSVDEAPIGGWAAGAELLPTNTGLPARFIQVAAVELTESDFASACPTGSASPLCTLYGTGATDRGGLLLYGSGRPYRKSGLFLAFIKKEDIGHVDSAGKPIVSYRSPTGWSFSEQDAVSATHYPDPPPCDNWLEPDWDRDVTPESARSGGCWSDLPGQGWDKSLVFGEISARLIRSGTAVPQIVLLNNSTRVFYWKAPLAFPGAGHFANPPAEIDHDTKTYGYSPYIIDGFGDTTFPNLSGDTDSITLWHTISVWDGSNNTPYGVYTGSEVIPWQ